MASLVFMSSAFLFMILTTSVLSQQLLSPHLSECPQAMSLIRSMTKGEVVGDPRMGASLLRMHFHDCFVNGCDGSILLEDDPIRGFKGEKTAPPNNNSIRGYEVIDKIKVVIEAECPGVISCADILAVAARDAVVMLGGPSWEVKLGRQDSKTAKFDDVIPNIPGPSSNLSDLIDKFSAKGFSIQEMVALSGAHTIGQARCPLFMKRVKNEADIDRVYAKFLKQRCNVPGNQDVVSPLDAFTPTAFDNSYYKLLKEKKGLLHTDQELFRNASSKRFTKVYKNNATQFLVDFGKAMEKMSNLGPVTGQEGEVRLFCRKPNS